MTRSRALSGPYPPTRIGRPIRLEDPEFRARTIQLACTGISRSGLALTMGIASGLLGEWLGRGRAQPDIEPWGSWSREFLAAERSFEGIGCLIQSQTVAHIAQKPAAVRTLAEVQWVGQLLATRFPAEHGNASAGTGNARVIQQEPDAEAWWEKHGLQMDQLRALLKDPPEAVEQAMVAEGDAIYARLVAGGWSPPALMKGKS